MYFFEYIFEAFYVVIIVAVCNRINTNAAIPLNTEERFVGIKTRSTLLNKDTNYLKSPNKLTEQFSDYKEDKDNKNNDSYLQEYKQMKHRFYHKY